MNNFQMNWEKRKRSFQVKRSLVEILIIVGLVIGGLSIARPYVVSILQIGEIGE